jgi:hypothetical protein
VGFGGLEGNHTAELPVVHRQGGNDLILVQIQPRDLLCISESPVTIPVAFVASRYQIGHACMSVYIGNHATFDISIMWPPPQAGLPSQKMALREKQVPKQDLRVRS